MHSKELLLEVSAPSASLSNATIIRPQATGHALSSRWENETVHGGEVCPPHPQWSR